MPPFQMAMISPGVLRVVAPFENDVVDTRADDAEGHADDEAVGKVIRGDAEVLRPGIDVERGEDKAGADDDAVPVDVLSEHGAGHAVSVNSRPRFGKPIVCS